MCSPGSSRSAPSSPGKIEATQSELRRLVIDLDQVECILGEIAIASDDDSYRLAHETNLVGGDAVVRDWRLDPDGKRLRMRKRVGAGYDTNHSLRTDSRGSID